MHGGFEKSFSHFSVSSVRCVPHWQHERSDCMGGHLAEPYEQNTQQSPGFGRNTTLQLPHS